MRKGTQEFHEVIVELAAQTMKIVRCEECMEERREFWDKPCRHCVERQKKMQGNAANVR